MREWPGILSNSISSYAIAFLWLFLDLVSPVGSGNLVFFDQAPNLKKQNSNKHQMSNSNNTPSATQELRCDFFLFYLFGSWDLKFGIFSTKHQIPRNKSQINPKCQIKIGPSPMTDWDLNFCFSFIWILGFEIFCQAPNLKKEIPIKYQFK